MSRCFLLLIISAAQACEARVLLRLPSKAAKTCGHLAMSRNLPAAKAAAMVSMPQSSNEEALPLPDWLKKQMHRSSGASTRTTLAMQRHSSKGRGATTFPVSSSQYEHAQSLRDAVWVFSSYHKTGTVLIQKMLGAFNNHNYSAVWHVDKALCEGAAELFSNELWGNSYSHPAMPVIQKTLRKYRFVHFIRDPVNIIVSAYRYHTEGGERWLYVKQIREADDTETGEKLEVLEKLLSDFSLTRAEKKALMHFRQAAEGGLTTLDYYRAAPEEEGVVVQAFHSWPDIDLLLQNYESTRGNPHALQMRMESLQENFQKSMRCMFEFLIESRPFNVDEAMRTVAPLDVHTGHHANNHVTSGKYDNTEITKVLKGMAPVAAAQRALHRPAAREC